MDRSVVAAVVCLTGVADVAEHQAQVRVVTDRPDHPIPRYGGIVCLHVIQMTVSAGPAPRRRTLYLNLDSSAASDSVLPVSELNARARPVTDGAAEAVVGGVAAGLRKTAGRSRSALSVAHVTVVTSAFVLQRMS